MGSMSESTYNGDRSYQWNENWKKFKQESYLNHQRSEFAEEHYKSGRVCYPRCNHKIREVIPIVEMIHKGNKSVQSFQQSSNYAEQENIHPGEKADKWNPRGIISSQIFKTNKVKKIHSEKKSYKCRVCGKGFLHASNLNQHQKIHKEEKHYKCRECGKAFRNSSTLNKHQRMHPGEKLYKCRECGKRFLHASNLNRHRQIIMERNITNVENVVKPLDGSHTLLRIRVFILERSLINVENVANPLCQLNNWCIALALARAQGSPAFQAPCLYFSDSEDNV